MPYCPVRFLLVLLDDKCRCDVIPTKNISAVLRKQGIPRTHTIFYTRIASAAVNIILVIFFFKNFAFFDTLTFITRNNNITRLLRVYIHKYHNRYNSLSDCIPNVIFTNINSKRFRRRPTNSYIEKRTTKNVKKKKKTSISINAVYYSTNYNIISFDTQDYKLFFFLSLTRITV